MTKSTRKILSVVIALALTLVLGITAFAAWPSFQNTNTNNGIISQQPPIAAPAVTAAPLVVNNPNADVYTGIDATSVINNGIAYTVYNGGHAPVGSVAGGARIQATTLSTGAPVWNAELFDANASGPVDVHADNVSQLSTPYYKTGPLFVAEDTIFALKTYFVAAPLTGTQTPTFTAGATTTVTYTVIVPEDFWEPQFVITLPSGTASGALSGNVTLTGPATVTFGNQNFYGGDTFTLYNNSGSIVPGGQYTLTLTVMNNTGADITATAIALNVSRWAFYSVVASNGSVTRLATGYGQANTPISYDRSDGKYLYWGIYGGDRTYYEYSLSGGYLFPLNGVTDDFYGAGAAFIGSYAVFGSDSGTLYLVNLGSFNIGPYQAHPMNSNFPNDKIRSSIAVDQGGTNVYFTSTYTDPGAGIYDSELWQLSVNEVLANSNPLPSNAWVPLTNASTSTPVISANNIIYVGTYNGFTGGTVDAYDPGNRAATVPTPPSFRAAVYKGDPVQSSPIVWSTGVGPGPNRNDYIYFTTNSGIGRGYGYSFMLSSNTPTQIFAAGGTSSNPYAVQGFSADNGYLVYGDDGNYLYIMH
jgi:hypothetical protein